MCGKCSTKNYIRPLHSCLIHSGADWCSYYFQQLTYEQIAEMEGCRYQSVQESILSAIEKLRKFFK